MKKIHPFVWAQILCIIMLLYLYGSYTQSEWIILQLAAIAWAIWSLVQFKWSNFSVNPTPKDDSKLITTGPYSIIRNPMYLALIVYFSAFVLDDFNWLGLNFLVLLLITLLLKLNFEESLLRSKFSSYDQYAMKTKKLIPYLY